MLINMSMVSLGSRLQIQGLGSKTPDSYSASDHQLTLLNSQTVPHHCGHGSTQEELYTALCKGLGANTS